MLICCLDLEGVLIPEIWIEVAKRTSIDGLKLTTRDIPDYDELMQHRLGLLEEHSIGLASIQSVIGEMSPLPGAADFLEALREQFQVAILSDTFYEFARPLMRQLHSPLLLCHRLVIEDDRIAGYQLRQADSKREAVLAFRSLNYQVLAAGDSYNDTAMLTEADSGVLFCPPDNVIREFPQFEVVTDYADLLSALTVAAEQLTTN